jgi:hypothetical protein
MVELVKMLYNYFSAAPVFSLIQSLEVFGGNFLLYDTFLVGRRQSTARLMYD